MGVKMELAEDVLNVWLTGEIDHHSATLMREQIDETAERTRPSELRLHFGGVTFMDSSGVGLIMGRYRLMTGILGKLTLREIPEGLERMMRLAGLEKLPIWDKDSSKGESHHETYQ